MTATRSHRSERAADLGAETLELNRGIFDRLIDIASGRASDDRLESAVEWVRVAASFAMTNPVGVLRSDRLEAVVDQIAARALRPSPRERRRSATGESAPPRRVLHVVSEARSIGGLTRLAERWIRHDTASTSSIVVTLQSEVVEPLVAAVAASGGVTAAFGLGDAIAQAAELRRLGEEADFVICHLHPGDPVPALAFGAGYRGAPVALFNHSDHLFWLAPTGASLVVDFREAGAVLTEFGRGYGTAARHRLPLLVPGAAASGLRDEARARLGFADADVVAVSVARAVKFEDTPLEPRFADLIAEALDRNPRLVYCAVGPGPDDSPWPGLLARYPGRIRLTGPLPDPQACLNAADLYLDTFPFSSLTSLLEASSANLPVLTFDGHHGLRKALGIADFVADDLDRPDDLATFQRRLTDLVGDDGLRRARGAAARGVFDQLTTDGSWLDRLEALYTRLDELSAAGRTIGETPAPPASDELADYSLAILAIEQRSPLLWSLHGAIARLDERDRRAMRMRTVTARAVRKLDSIVGWSPRNVDRLLLPAAP
ncbi:hypothetical protein FLP10_11850 [Agromyces intestinalis]|uniref:Glycosyltransferase n=1 Tax=Agromyces intestinalis TaxID=2592652 RepID=A0A5C1YJN2_9MICO|nr:hypothetical protein [Agromyces intestinalis]QEO15032.1 hypothetical protein FLP10_11850 [Agromyces intestinalis]